jgi:hypothetical protein
MAIVAGMLLRTLEGNPWPVAQAHHPSAKSVHYSGGFSALPPNT